MSKNQKNSESLFLIDPDLWADVSRDVIQFSTNGNNLTPSFLQKKYGLTSQESEFISFAVLNKDIIHNEVNKDLSDRKYKSAYREIELKNKQLMAELEMSEQRTDFLLNTQNKTDIKKLNISIKPDKAEVREATAFGILSDIHLEEKVELELVNGLNEYNPDIAKNRVEKFFVNFLKLVNKERHSSKINKAVLALLGDNITGYIHEDLKETNYLSPTEATLYAKDIIISGIKYLVEQGNFTEIIVPCCKGNHGRTTTTKRFSSAYKNSYEWMMYHDIENMFEILGSVDKRYKIVKFIIPKSELTYIEVYGKTIRFGHGDHFSFGGGVGGMIIPMSKWLFRINEQKSAYMTFIAHWHSILTEPTHNCMVNGSIIGMTGYGVSFGGVNRDPQQIFALLDSKRGFSVRAHIDVL